MKYVRKIDGKMEIAPNETRKNGMNILGYNKSANSEMLMADGYIAYKGGLPLSQLDIVDGQIIETPLTSNPFEYDQAIENKLDEVRHERGYTVREPSLYINSSNPRWKQDAIDWIAYVDIMMAYGQDVLNSYSLTGNVPTLEDFKAGFPKIIWTYKEA